MKDNPWRAPRLSGDAMLLMALLLRNGGGMRIDPLLRITRLPTEDLAAAVNELVERLWVDIAWRGDHARRPDALPERARGIRRIVTTLTGRHCYRYVPKYEGL
jgi:hypothetical protein